MDEKESGDFFSRTSLGARSVLKERATCILTALMHILSEAPVLIESMIKSARKLVVHPP